MSKLAKHVVHRKATLSFLDSRRELQSSGKYLLEDAVHKVIFPLKQTSDDVPPDKMNLWIIRRATLVPLLPSVRQIVLADEGRR